MSNHLLIKAQWSRVRPHELPVLVLSQEFDEVDDWESEYAETTLLNTVLADFCQYHGLSVAGTQFKHGRENLHPSQALQRVTLCLLNMWEEVAHCC